MGRLLKSDPFAAVFFVLGWLFLYQALRLSMRSLDGGPGPGLLPGVLGLLTVVFSGRVLVARVAEWPVFGNLSRVGIMVAGLAVFGFALDRLGFVLTSALVMVLLLSLFNERHRTALAALGVLGALAAYALFYSVLKVQLPADPWGLWR